MVVSCFAGWHGFDLAQGLDRVGKLQYLVTLASPRLIEARYGIPRTRIRRLPLAPLLHRLEWWCTDHAPVVIKDLYYQFFCCLYDRFTLRLLNSKTRMLVAWYPFATTALQWASERGIVTMLDVGSTHPHDQYRVICHEHQQCQIPMPWVPSRVLAQTWSFDQVDWLAVPSRTVHRSFVEAGIPADKLLLNPYGIDTDLFLPSPQPIRTDPFTVSHPLRIIIVAGLTPRKGSRLLLDVCKHFVTDQRVSFTLVGTIDPLVSRYVGILPSNLYLHQPVSQTELAQLYRDHHICFLPSIEEGFARVLIEAAGCGLTLVATSLTGLSDILAIDPNAGYQLGADSFIDAINIIERVLNQKLLLCHASSETVEYFRRDAYQARAINNIITCLND